MSNFEDDSQKNNANLPHTQSNRPRKRIIIESNKAESKILSANESYKQKLFNANRIDPQSAGNLNVTSILNPTSALLSDAKLIAAAELARFRAKVTKGIALDLKESRIIQGYLSELTKLQKEEREQARSTDLSNLSNDELMQLAQEVLVSTQPKLIKE